MPYKILFVFIQFTLAILPLNYELNESFKTNIKHVEKLNDNSLLITLNNDDVIQTNFEQASSTLVAKKRFKVIEFQLNQILKPHFSPYAGVITKSAECQAVEKIKRQTKETENEIRTTFHLMSNSNKTISPCGAANELYFLTFEMLYCKKQKNFSIFKFFSKKKFHLLGIGKCTN